MVKELPDPESIILSGMQLDPETSRCHSSLSCLQQPLIGMEFG